MAEAAADQPPMGLDAHHLGIWRHGRKVLVEQRTWEREQKPMLDEYVVALREASTARAAAELAPYHETEKGLLHPHPGFAVADRATRRAVQLAELLLLTPAARRAHGLLEEGADGTEGDQAGL